MADRRFQLCGPSAGPIGGPRFRPRSRCAHPEKHGYSFTMEQRHGRAAVYRQCERCGRSMSFLDSRHQTAPQGIGKPLRRREDVSFLTGAGRYADDMSLFRLVREKSGVSKDPRPPSATGVGLAAAIIDRSARHAERRDCPRHPLETFGFSLPEPRFRIQLSALSAYQKTPGIPPFQAIR